LILMGIGWTTPTAANAISGLYVGVSGGDGANADGSSRQEEIRRCLPGEPVHLSPRSGADGLARIDVISARSRQVGEIVGADAASLCDQLAAGETLIAEINGIHGHNSANRRLVILVRPVRHTRPRARAIWSLFRRRA
jgi:hypothetical protein